MKSIPVILALFTAAGLFSGTAFRHEPVSAAANLYSEPQVELQTGDVVLRSGKGFISDMFRKFNLTGSPWSHAGILVKEGQEWQVCHIMGHDDDTQNKLRKEPLREFCNSNSNTGFAIYRKPGLNLQASLIRQYLDSLSEAGLRFDHQFNLQDDQYMYCSELVYKTMVRTGFDSIPLAHLKGESYVAIDQLIQHPVIQKVIEKHY